MFMRHRLFYASGLLALATFVLVAAAEAQTTAVGPYYATPSWDQTLTCSTPANCPRFVVLSNFGSQAVLDRETGLVWERSPDQTPTAWVVGSAACRNKLVGKRFGWRLPTIEELMSLMDGDPANTDEPRLPPGHPFLGLVPTFYWSTTTDPDFPDRAYILRFSVQVFGGLVVKHVNSIPSWCVRGGPVSDRQ
jgi:hypothetical protein